MGSGSNNYYTTPRGEQEKGPELPETGLSSCRGTCPQDSASSEGVHIVLVNKSYQSLSTQPLSTTLKTWFLPYIKSSLKQGLLQLVHSKLEWVGVHIGDLKDKLCLSESFQVLIPHSYKPSTILCLLTQGSNPTCPLCTNFSILPPLSFIWEESKALYTF